MVGLGSVGPKFHVGSTAMARNAARVPSRLSSLGKSHHTSRLTFIVSLPTGNGGALGVALSSRGDGGRCRPHMCTRVVMDSGGKGRIPIRSMAVPNATGVCGRVRRRNPTFRSRLITCHLCFSRGRAMSVCKGFGGNFRVGRSRFCPASRRLTHNFNSSMLHMDNDYNMNTLGN